MKFKVILFVCFFVAGALTTVDAAYLKNVPQKIVQPDGRILNCLATGDERYNWLHDYNNFTIMQNPSTGYFVYAKRSGKILVPTDLIAGIADPAAAGLLPGINADPEEIRRISKDRFQTPVLKGASSSEAIGTINNIVIFIRFSDQAEYTTATSTYNSAFNASGAVSLVDYFLEVSNAQLTINTSLYPSSSGTVVSYQDANPRNYYRVFNLLTNPTGYIGETERRTREMTLLKNATESVKAQIEATGLDFDYNDDGYVDNVCYIIQGATEGWSELLWPHMWSLYTYDVRIGTARVYNFNFQLSESFGVSVLCHEMSHSLGFPDLYRYTDTSITPVGYWDIMSWNSNPPQHQSVYNKYKYGQWFAGIPEITATGTYTLDPVSTNPYAGYKIASPNSTTEFFMVEYRKSTGRYESGLPGSGLIIYRVNQSLNGNSDGPPDEVYVYRLNGTTTVDGSINSANFSTESGRTTFNATSNPSCFLSSGSPGGIEITSIGSAGSTISFTVTLPTPPSILTVLPASQSVAFTAGTTSFNVTNTGSGTMAWTAAVTTGPSWVHITSGSSGSNAGTISVSVDANPDNAIRTGVITVTAPGATGSPKTVNIVQAANPPVLSVLPASRSVAFTSGTTSFDVTNTGGGTMVWTAAVTTGPSWVHITSGSSGSNTGTIGVSVDLNPDNATRTGVITITAAGASGSPKTVNIVQAANPPVLSVLPASRSMAFTAGTSTFDVTNTGGGTMAWTAAVTTGPSWVHITSGTSGSNAGTINISVDLNPDNAVRTGVITVTAAGAGGSPKTVDIIQAANPPVLSVLPATRSVAFASGTTTFDVSNTGGGSMAWTAAVTTGPSWVHISSGASGTNSGTITVFFDTNPDNAIRTGILTVTAPGVAGSPMTVSIEQAANPPVLTVSPSIRSIPFTVGTTSFDVSNSGGGTMVWTAAVTTGASWVHITSGVSGSNSGTINVSADANPDNVLRTGIITITAAGATGSPLTVTVEQAANPPVLNVLPASRSLAYTSGTTTFDVTNSGGGTMAWSAAVTTGPSWVHISSGASGSNAGTISVSVDVNPDNVIRTGVITVTAAGAGGSPKTVTIIQAANPPVLAISPASQSVAFESGVTTFEVQNTGGGTMSWSAAVTTGSSWVHISSGASGSNTGTITVFFDTNPDNAIRTGTITVTAAGALGSPKSVNIIQAPNPPILNVLPASRAVAYIAGTTSFDVTNTGGGIMAWSAAVTTGSSWVHISSGASGSNSGTITVFYDTNPDNAIRTGVLTVTASGATGSPVAVSIEQAANPPVLAVSPPLRSVSFESGITTFEVNNNGGGTMLWGAAVTTGASWVHIGAGLNGTNSGTITVFYDANPDNSIRTGSITVTAAGATGSPMTVSVEQAPNPPVLLVLPATRTVNSEGGITSFEVANTGGGSMAWVAAVTVGSSWTHISSGENGNNNGTITLFVDANPGNDVRSSTITVLGTGAANSPAYLTIEQEAKALMPDLTIPNLTAIVPAITWPEKIRVSLTVENIGQCPSVATVVHFYLSHSQSSTDISADLGQISCDPITNGMTWTRELELPITETIVPGNYFLLALVDSPTLNNELDELNNRASVPISILNGIENTSENFRFSVYPNPADSYLHIDLDQYESPIEQIVVTDMLGQVVYSRQTEQAVPFKTTIDVSAWNKGCYQISLYSAGRIFHKIFMHQ